MAIGLKPEEKPLSIWLLPQLPISPSRFIARILIYFGVMRGFKTVIAWNIMFYVFLATIYYLLYFGPLRGWLQYNSTLIAALCVCGSRITELVLAFYGDAWDRKSANYSAAVSRSRINTQQRITLLTLAYVEIVLYFGATYFILQLVSRDELFERSISSVADTLYFSAITITTTGYGDLAPKGFARGLAAYEALVGVVFIALGLAAYLSDTSETSSESSLRKS